MRSWQPHAGQATAARFTTRRAEIGGGCAILDTAVEISVDKVACKIYSLAMNAAQRYRETHPWLTFTFAIEFDKQAQLWALLGEA